MWGQQGQKITWQANNTPDSQKQAGGWYDNPATGYNTQWNGAGQSTQPSVSSPAGSSMSNSSSNSYNYTPPDYTKIAQDQLAASKANAQPAVDALTASKQPLQDRYKAVLDSITNQQGTAVQSAQIGAANEFSARGIPLESGAYTQFLANRVNPVSQYYAGLGAQTSGQENVDLSNIDTAIAQLKSGAGSSSIANALSLYGAQQSGGLQASQLGFNQRYITIPNVGVYDVLTKQIINQLNGGGSTGSIQIINGQPYVNI